MNWKVIIIGTLTTLLILIGGLYWRITNAAQFAIAFNENCASCHGENLAGTGLGSTLVGVELNHGDTVAAISQSIANGFPQKCPKLSMHNRYYHNAHS